MCVCEDAQYKTFESCDNVVVVFAVVEFPVFNIVVVVTCSCSRKSDSMSNNNNNSQPLKPTSNQHC